MFTSTYLLSQFFSIINYATLIISYQIKDNKKILIYSSIGCFFSALSFYLLNAYSGCAMALLAVLRNILFIIDKKHHKRRNIYTLMFILISLLVRTYFTYDGIFSLLPVIATLLYTISVWIDDINIYRRLGIPTEMFWLSYHIYLKSIVGVIFETILFISVIIGFLRMKKQNIS